MKDTILFQSISPEELANVILDGVKSHLNQISPRKSEKAELEFLTRKETADLLKVSLTTIHDWMNNGIIKPYKLGNRTYFNKKEIEQSLLNSNQVCDE